MVLKKTNISGQIGLPNPQKVAPKRKPVKDNMLVPNNPVGIMNEGPQSYEDFIGKTACKAAFTENKIWPIIIKV
jgi:hypothetical protein